MNIKKILQRWTIVHDPYSDFFQIYDSVVFNLDKSDVIEVKKKNTRLLIEKNTSKPVLFEMKKIYEITNVEVDTLTKSTIINLVNPYIQTLLESKLHHYA